MTAFLLSVRISKFSVTVRIWVENCVSENGPNISTNSKKFLLWKNSELYRFSPVLIIHFFRQTMEEFCHAATTETASCFWMKSQGKKNLIHLKKQFFTKMQKIASLAADFRLFSLMLLFQIWQTVFLNRINTLKK